MPSHKRQRTATLTELWPNPKRVADASAAATSSTSTLKAAVHNDLAHTPQELKTAIHELSKSSPDVVLTLLQRAATLTPSIADDVMRQHNAVVQRFGNVSLKFSSIVIQVADILALYLGRPSQEQEALAAEALPRLEAAINHISTVATHYNMETDRETTSGTKRNALVALADIGTRIVDAGEECDEIFMTSLAKMLSSAGTLEKAMLAIAGIMSDKAFDKLKTMDNGGFVDKLRHVADAGVVGVSQCVIPFEGLEELVEWFDDDLDDYDRDESD